MNCGLLSAKRLIALTGRAGQDPSEFFSAVVKMRLSHKSLFIYCRKTARQGYSHDMKIWAQAKGTLFFVFFLCLSLSYCWAHFNQSTLKLHCEFEKWNFLLILFLVSPPSREKRGIRLS